MRLKFACRPQQSLWLKKFISVNLALGILLNNTLFNSFASVLSEDNRYETFKGNSIKIDNILEEDKVDVEIEGNTLTNLAKDLKYWNTAGNSTFNYENNSITISNTSTYSKIYKTFKLKPNTKYTFIVNCVNNSENSAGSYLRFVDNVHGSYAERIGKTDSNKSNVHKKSFVTDSTGIANIALEKGVYAGSVKYSNAILIEGDYKDEEIEYFEGLKSVGENNENGDSIEIVSQNKNLFCGEFEFGGYTGTTGEPYSSTERIRTKNTIHLKKGTYSVSSSDNTEFIAMSLFKHGTFIKEIGYYTNNMHPYVLDEDYDIHLTLGTTDLKTPVQIELGKKATTYTSYQSDNKKIFLKEPLRGIEDSVKDRIIKKNGRWVIERNYGQLIVDGSQPISKEYSFAPLNTELVRFNININEILEGEENKLLSDKLPYIYIHPAGSVNVSQECISNHSNDRGFLNVVIKKSRLSGDDIDGFKNWISNNPITIIYRLETPIYEPLNIDSTINTYLDTTHVSTNSTIPANLKVTVDRVANRAKEYSELAKENPTIENISLARMWTNKMRESILKDEFQDSVDNITEITDMTLDRKTASANLDVYIKSENILMMSLSTNSITFDDFSGVEDMVKENAVQISINSSLPYSLNAYLPTEIQNADKSNTMDKDILNIKENSESAYQTFSNTTDKIVLKDNCSAGNDLMHGVDIKLKGGIAHEKDVYKTTIKFEAEQK